VVSRANHFPRRIGVHLLALLIRQRPHSQTLGAIFMTSKDTLKELVDEFRKWLADNYSEEEIKDDRVDSPSFNNWNRIEDYFTFLLDNDELKNLDEEDKINLLYLIGRNWDIGNMLAWLSPNSPLSNCGHLKESDFISLARIAKDLHGLEFHDAKSQIIVSFQKFHSLTDDIKNILLDFYETGEEYSKRMSMETLAKLGYEEIRSLVERSWREQDDEHHRMMCLGIIHEYIRDSELLEKYLALAEKDDRQYISAYLKKIKADR
jgi:hypothetical protein